MMPDGMGADRYRERQHMREMSQEVEKSPYVVVAVDEDGEELYEAEAAWSKEAAIEERDACDNLIGADDGNVPSYVDHFDYRER